MKNIEIEIYGVKIEMENILITDFGEFLQSQIENRKDNKIDFSSIHTLQGEKNIMEQAFKDVKKESVV
jgi:hypothetical protein